MAEETKTCVEIKERLDDRCSWRGCKTDWAVRYERGATALPQNSKRSLTFCSPHDKVALAESARLRAKDSAFQRDGKPEPVSVDVDKDIAEAEDED